MRRLLLAVLTVGLGPAAAQPSAASVAGPSAAFEGCEDVARALALARRRPVARVKAIVLSGRHPDGWRSMESVLAGDRQRLRLDGRDYAARSRAPDEAARDRARGLAALDPQGPCECVNEGGATRFYYEAGDVADGGALAARAPTVVTMTLDAYSWLPRSVLIEGPELQYGRVLGRPGTPPRAVLKPTGGRYRERREYVWDEAGSAAP